MTERVYEVADSDLLLLARRIIRLEHAAQMASVVLARARDDAVVDDETERRWLQLEAALRELGY